ncbi:MAG: hypothetical protein AB8B55_04425 [Mariniblastus sp.]
MIRETLASICFGDIVPVIADASILVVAAFERARGSSLVLGLGTLAAGILLFLSHKRHLDSVWASNVADRIKDFESRKFRRRAIANAMITSVGFMLASLYWVTEPKILSIFVMMILTLLLGILGIAIIDLFSVGLHEIARPDESQKEKIQELLRQREAKKKEEEQQT